MKKLLFLIVLILALVVGYLLGSGGSGWFTSETVRRQLRTEVGVRTALALNKQLDGTNIQVGVRDGDALLSGTVNNIMQRDLAEEIAGSIEGVRSVTNRLTVDPDAVPTPAAAADRSLGQRLDDLTTAARVRTALALHRDINRGDVDVSVNAGEVHLTGTVPSWVARELAGKVVEDVEGVVRVRNDLRVQTGATVTSPESGTTELPPPAAAPDEESSRRVTDASVRLQIEAALHVNPYIEARRINVEVDHGQVTLRGYARTEADKALAQKIAEDAWGVTGVDNQIVVDPEPEPPLRYNPPATQERVRPDGR